MPNAEKISITPELLGLIRESVESGEYASTSEALRDAVHIWHRQQLEDAARVAVIRARVRRSIEDPRPSLSETDIDARLTVLFTQAGTASGDAAG